MRTETEATLKKIKRVSNILRIICKLGMIVATCVFIGAVVLILIGHGSINFYNNYVQLAPLSASARLLLAIVTALSMTVIVKGFYHLNRLLGNYGRGDI